MNRIGRRTILAMLIMAPGDHLEAVRSLTMFGSTRIPSPRPLKTRPPRFKGALAQKNK
jgi:hypothetical protein